MIRIIADNTLNAILTLKYPVCSSLLHQTEPAEPSGIKILDEELPLHIRECILMVVVKNLPSVLVKRSALLRPIELFNAVVDITHINCFKRVNLSYNRRPGYIIL